MTDSARKGLTADMDVEIGLDFVEFWQELQEEAQRLGVAWPVDYKGTRRIYECGWLDGGRAAARRLRP